MRRPSHSIRPPRFISGNVFSTVIINQKEESLATPLLLHQYLFGFFLDPARIIRPAPKKNNMGGPWVIIGV
jgi:hypothetical protein